MNVTLHADPTRLRIDETGSIRVGSSRVTLDVLLADFLNGMSPEQIASELDTLSLADVYGAISYYFRYRDEVDEYLRQRKLEAEALRRKIEESQPKRPNLKAELLARLAQRGIELDEPT